MSKPGDSFQMGGMTVQVACKHILDWFPDGVIVDKGWTCANCEQERLAARIAELEAENKRLQDLVDGVEPEPTPEEIAETRRYAEERFAARMIPARNETEQQWRDSDAAMQELLSMYASVEGDLVRNIELDLWVEFDARQKKAPSP